MNPMIVLSALFATAMAAPAPAYVAAPAPALGYAAAPALAYAAAPAPAVAVPAPPPKVTVTQAAGSTVVNKPPAIVNKQLHYGSTTYLANVHEQIHKPATPHFPIAVPTALKAKVQVNPAITKYQIQSHVVNEPYAVPKEVKVPVDVPVYVEKEREVPVPVHVQKPYAVPVPTPVQGEPIVQHVQGPAIVKHSHTQIAAAPVLAHAGYAAAAPLAAAPLAAAPLAAAPLAAAPLAAPAGYAVAPSAYGLAGATLVAPAPAAQQ